MNRRTDTSPRAVEGGPQSLAPSTGEGPPVPACGCADAELSVGRDDPPTGGDDVITRTVNDLLKKANHDPWFLKQLAGFKDTTLLLSATDTGRQLMITLNGLGASVRPYVGGLFDVKIRATEEVHRAVLFGEMDADAAFFSGKVRISGSLITAFGIKNKFLSFLQRHLTTESQALKPDNSSAERWQT